MPACAWRRPMQGSRRCHRQRSQAQGGASHVQVTSPARLFSLSISSLLSSFRCPPFPMPLPSSIYFHRPSLLSPFPSKIFHTKPHDPHLSLLQTRYQQAFRHASAASHEGTSNAGAGRRRQSRARRPATLRTSWRGSRPSKISKFRFVSASPLRTMSSSSCPAAASFPEATARNFSCDDVARALRCHESGERLRQALRQQVDSLRQAAFVLRNQQVVRGLGFRV